MVDSDGRVVTAHDHGAVLRLVRQGVAWRFSIFLFLVTSHHCRGWLRLDALVLLMRSFIKERGAAFRPRKKLSMDKPNMMDLSDDELQSLSSITRAGVIARHFSRYMEESFRVFVRRRENEENDGKEDTCTII